MTAKPVVISEALTGTAFIHFAAQLLQHDGAQQQKLILFYFLKEDAKVEVNAPLTLGVASHGEGSIFLAF